MDDITITMITKLISSLFLWLGYVFVVYIFAEPIINIVVHHTHWLAHLNNRLLFYQTWTDLHLP